MEVFVGGGDWITNLSVQLVVHYTFVLYTLPHTLLLLMRKEIVL